jgi:hypothetical protein
MFPSYRRIAENEHAFQASAKMKSLEEVRLIPSVSAAGGLRKHHSHMPDKNSYL